MFVYSIYIVQRTGSHLIRSNMAENGNGKWTMWIIGIILCTALPYIGSAVIVNDKDSRARDDKINESVNKSIIEQKQVNQEILLALKEIQVDMKYIRKNGTN